MNFKEAEFYLLSLGNEVSAMKLGLESIRTLLAALGNPQNNYLKVQVAGTNGKGSVCAFLNSICLRARISTGMFTSPHLVSMTERIQIDGAEISENDFAKLATSVRQVSETLLSSGELENVPTFFEQITAIALLAFAEAKVALAILETGLGGRLDATTAANAEIAAITRIDLDHQQYLGETLREIAAEKAAIIHGGSKVMALPQAREVENVIKGRCREVGVEPAWATKNISIHKEKVVLPAVVATFVTERTAYKRVLLWSMLGLHQIENAALAVGIAERLMDVGFKIDTEAVQIGLETATHPGRLEFLDGVLLDGAHNIGGVHALREFLDENIGRPIVMVFGSMNDKDIAAITSVIFPKADRLVLTTPENSRAMPAEDLLQFVPDGLDRERIFITPNATAAIAKARAVSGERDLILVTGSLYLVGEVRRLLGEPSPETEN